MELGFVMEIPDQTGDEMPDGLAKFDDAFYFENAPYATLTQSHITTYSSIDQYDGDYYSRSS